MASGRELMRAAIAPRVTETDRWTAWDRFLESTPDAGFMQSSWWAEFRAASGYRCFGVTVKDRDAIVGGAMVMRWSFAPGGCFYCIPEGPVLPADASLAAEVFESILGSVDRHRRSEDRTVSHLRIEPRWRHRPDFVREF